MTDALDHRGVPEERSFRAERALSPVDGAHWWVVIDAGLMVHKEATDFLRCLDGASLSPHTVRVYAGRVAAFLGWCDFELTFRTSRDRYTPPLQLAPAEV